MTCPASSPDTNTTSSSHTARKTTNTTVLETHDVDASLKDKLKCLVFIPIISRTYCDPKSFAWVHEFKVFKEQASADQFGLKVKVPGGNVANRVLPIQSHELDLDDKKLVEDELGGFIRGIDFIYKETGVNRPLKPDDNEKKNLNNTKYINQINKVANAIKEIIMGLKSTYQKGTEESNKLLNERHPERKSLITKIIAASTLMMALVIGGYFIVNKLIKPKEQFDRSIAVLPFENMSNDPEQDYFCNRIMEEILNHLFMIGGLKIPSSTSSMRFKGSDLPVKEIARRLEVSYVLEGRVSRLGDDVRIIVRLINGLNEKLLWTKDYNLTMAATELFRIQSEVAQQVADNLKVVINSEVKKRIQNIPTTNTEAYNLYMQVYNQTNSLPFEQAKSILEKVISLDNDFADAKTLLALRWIWAGGHDGSLTREQVLEKAEPLLAKALHLDENSIMTHCVIATLRLYYYWDFESVEKEFRIVRQLDPSNSYMYAFFCDYLLSLGRFQEAFELVKNNFDLNKGSSSHWISLVLAYYYNEQQRTALETLETTQSLFPDDSFIYTNSIRIFTYLGKYKEEIDLFEKTHGKEKLDSLIPYYLGHLGIAFLKTGDKSKSEEFLNELISRSKYSVAGSPSFFAAGIYTAMGANDKALQALEKGYEDHEVEMYWLKVEPLFRPLHGDPRFENLLNKIGFK